jgi:hypothetical protein
MTPPRLPETTEALTTGWFTREQCASFSLTLSAYFQPAEVLLISAEVALPKSYPFKYLSHNVSKNHDVKHDQGSCQTLHLETPSLLPSCLIYDRDKQSCA